MKNKIAADIMAQLAGEANAIQAYEVLLASGELLDKDKAIISEQISDEKNHQIKLMAMALRYDGIGPSPDDALASLNEISHNIKK